MTKFMVRRCTRCGKVIYKYKKGEPMSDLLKGCEIGIHLLVCDREKFDEILMKHF